MHDLRIIEQMLDNMEIRQTIHQAGRIARLVCGRHSIWDREVIHDNACDVAEEVLKMKAAEKQGGEKLRNEKAFATTLSNRRALDYLRRMHKRNQIEELHADVPDNIPTGEEGNVELRQEVYPALRERFPKEPWIYELLIGDLTNKESARRYGKTDYEVRQLRREAMEFLRTVLE